MPLHPEHESFALPEGGCHAWCETGDARALTGYLNGLVRSRLFRGAVEIQRGDEVVLRSGFDRADPRDGRMNGPRTRFRLASVTKQFTALAVLVLQEKRKLRVEDRVCAHLAACPRVWRAITIEQLLTHTSGLFDYSDLTESEGARYLHEFGDAPTPEQILTVFDRRPLLFAPGARWDYSNCGYDLLGFLVERLSGRSYGQFLREEILDPLGMTDSGFDPDGRDDAGDEPDAIGYSGWTTKAVSAPDALTYASGGMYATVDDMMRWDRFLLTGRPGDSYGYGIVSTGSAKDLVYFHAGNLDGFATYTAVRPGDDLAVTVLSNLATSDAPRIGTTLARMVVATT